MIPMMDVVAFAPKGSLLLCLRETEDEFWGELTNICGRLEDDDIARALAEAPLIYVVTCNQGYESVHAETLTSWDQEVRDLLVQQAEVRVGFFRTKERHQLGPELLTSPCGDRRPSPPVALLDTSLDEESICRRQNGGRNY
jgi:hypothetical protein